MHALSTCATGCAARWTLVSSLVRKTGCLQRSDAISGSLFSFISEPKNASNGGLVSSGLSLRLPQS